MIRQPDEAHGVRLKPLVRIVPTGSNFALCGKIDHELRLKRIEQFMDPLYVRIQIQL